MLGLHYNAHKFRDPRGSHTFQKSPTQYRSLPYNPGLEGWLQQKSEIKNLARWSNRTWPQTIHSLLTQTTLRHLSSSKRRRRAGSGTTPQTDSSEDDRSSANAAYTSTNDKYADIWLGDSRAYLDKVEEADEPVKAKNDVFKVTGSAKERGENLTITLKTEEGQ